jgi:hypothetical protein
MLTLLKILTGRIFPRAYQNSGAGGIFPCLFGFAIMSSSLLAAAGVRRKGII